MDMQIERLLDKLEEEIRGGKRSVFGNLRAVDDTKCLEYIASVRSMLPSSITEARVILQERDSILDDAHAQARDILSKARSDAAEILSESRILDEANRRADEIVGDARRRADDITADCYQGIMDMFVSAENNLRDSMKIVDKSKRELYELLSGDGRR